LLPKEAIRPLYRRAREVLALSRDACPGDDSDPLALLARYCEQVLPLPPFEVWCADFAGHPDAHLEDLEESSQRPTADAPSTVEVRAFRFAGRLWIARLRAFREGGLWRAFILFEEEGAGRVHRTGAVFCEREPGELRERFLAFEPIAMEAFLRSALP
jgi:hypothetical protein